MKERALIERGEENRERKGGTLEKERGMDGGRGTQRERGGGFSKWASLLMEAI